LPPSDCTTVNRATAAPWRGRTRTARRTSDGPRGSLALAIVPVRSGRGRRCPEALAVRSPPPVRSLLPVARSTARRLPPALIGHRRLHGGVAAAIQTARQVGRSQAVRQRFLVPPFPGSNPGAPANFPMSL